MLGTGGAAGLIDAAALTGEPGDRVDAPPVGEALAFGFSVDFVGAGRLAAGRKPAAGDAAGVFEPWPLVACDDVSAAEPSA
jgi:hypothetical protein